MLTDPGDLVIDPFAGSCVTGEVAEKTERDWVCIELVEDYLKGALGRFVQPQQENNRKTSEKNTYYKIPRPGLLWNGDEEEPLSEDGGKKRRRKKAKQLPLDLKGTCSDNAEIAIE